MVSLKYTINQANDRKKEAYWMFCVLRVFGSLYIGEVMIYFNVRTFIFFGRCSSNVYPQRMASDPKTYFEGLKHRSYMILICFKTYSNNDVKCDLTLMAYS